jgi:hypothetical protein
VESFADIVRNGTAKSAFEDLTGGSSDVLTKMTNDFGNSGTAFATITDLTRTMSFTPPANSDFEIEAWLLIQTPTATILPRVGVAVGAGQQYGAASIEQCGATVTTEAVQHGTFLTGAVNLQMPVGGLPAAATPYEAIIRVKGKSGATPGAIQIQLASETAGSSCTVKAGSRMITRVI